MYTNDFWCGSIFGSICFPSSTLQIYGPALIFFFYFVCQVKSAFLVVEPRSRISRGFAFITMDSLEDANRCIKHLNQSVLEGRYITVEKVRCFVFKLVKHVRFDCTSIFL